MNIHEYDYSSRLKYNSKTVLKFLKMLKCEEHSFNSRFHTAPGTVHSRLKKTRTPIFSRRTGRGSPKMSDFQNFESLISPKTTETSQDSKDDHELDKSIWLFTMSTQKSLQKMQGCCKGSDRTGARFLQVPSP